MTPQQIKDSAPEGATHIDRVGYYLKHTDDGWFVFSKLGYGWSKEPFIFTDCELDLYEIKPL